MGGCAYGDGSADARFGVLRKYLVVVFVSVDLRAVGVDAPLEAILLSWVVVGRDVLALGRERLDRSGEQWYERQHRRHHEHGREHPRTNASWRGDEHWTESAFRW